MDSKSGKIRFLATDRTSEGSDKIAKHGWKVTGQPGELKWLPKGVLDVDPAYQRQADNIKANSLASKFSWPAFGCIIVADRGDGTYFVIDGQHRKLAADKRSDVTLLPCVVFPMANLADEAQAFLDANTSRKALSAIGRMPASVAVGDPATLLVHELCTRAGRKMVANGLSGRTLRCIGRAVRLARDNPSVYRRVFVVCDELVGDVPMTERIIEGLCWVEANMQDGESIVSGKWLERIRSIGAPELDLAAKRAAAALAKGGCAAWGKGIVDRINRGLRHRLVLTNGYGGE